MEASFYAASRPAHKPPSADPAKGSTLVVTKLGTDDACHMAYVEPTNNPQANEQARAIADTEAAFTCKKDKAKHSGISSQ